MTGPGSESAHGVLGSAELYRARQVAESFGVDPERYDRSRPRYPEAMVRRIVAASPGHDVLDVGCGTGIAARQFQAAGCAVLGVDVDSRMAGWARRRGLDVEVATFEEWESKNRRFDAVVAGQSWHWIDPVVGAAKAAAVLRPAGRLAVFRNDGRAPSELSEAFAAVYRRVVPDFPFNPSAAGRVQAHSPILTSVEEGMRRARAFGEAERWHFDWERSYNKDEWLDLVPTTGGHTLLPASTLEELLAGIGAAIDGVGGSFAVQYATTVVTAARTIAT